MNHFSDTFRLGFGLMRLPKLQNGEIDIAQVCEMADHFIKAGGTYFDTAYVYDGGKSEDAFRQAVSMRYPRDAYTIATKLLVNASGILCEEDARQEFYTSLNRLDTKYIDYYLLHAIQRSNVQLYEQYGLWDFVRELKAKGLIRHWGFSFHADSELLEELLQKNPDAEFVQLQINYADWENPGVASRRNWEICKAHGKPVVIMEPVKGGILADPIPEVKTILKQQNPEASCASWALRYAASLDNLLTVLSGMSSLEQMDDNLISIQKLPLTESEMETIQKAQIALNSDQSIACTGCRYCTKGCPQEIPIPDIFHVINHRKGSPEFRTLREYNIVTQDRGKASDCIACGQCEAICPQHLPIIDLLIQCRSSLEKQA